MATSSVTLDITQYVRVNVAYTSMILQAHNDSVRVVMSIAKPAPNNIAFHALGGGDAPLRIDVVDVNVWVLAVSDKSSLIVTESSVLTPVTISDPNSVVLELDPFVKSIPITDTFHHLGHEGKVFIHSDRHSGLADAAIFDYLLRVPAGEPDRQVHLRFNFIGKANTGSLDIDICLYKDTVVSADGSSEPVVSTNDANVLTSGVLLFEGPTVTDIGTLKTCNLIVGEKKSASSKEQAVPEWILAPDGSNERNYLFRMVNNSGGTVDIVNAIFFYDTHAA